MPRKNPNYNLHDTETCYNNSNAIKDNTGPNRPGASPECDANSNIDTAPDGGFWGWAAVVGVHLTLMNTWGMNSSFGVFQTYYTDNLELSPDDVSWIGSLQVSILFFIGTFAGRLTDAGYFRHVFICGSVLICFGTFMTSICEKYWQILLLQGICVGVGNGLVFTPALAILGTYFKNRRALAFGVGSTGTATGGLIFPTMTRRLLPRIGLAWTLRAMGLVQVLTMVLSNLAFKPRLPPRRAGPFVEWTAFRDLEYAFFAAGMFCAFWGMYFAFYYIVSFATTQLNPPMLYLDSLNLLLVINGIGYIGRTVPNIIADKYFGLVTLMIPFTITSGVCLFAWMAVSTSGGLYGWALVYGIAAGGVQSLFPPGVASLTKDSQKIGVRMGMICTTNSFATLTGTPIAGAIIKASGGRFAYAQAFAGASLMLAALFFVASRRVATRKLGNGWKARI